MEAHKPDMYKQKESKPKMNIPYQKQNFNNKIDSPFKVNKARQNCYQQQFEQKKKYIEELKRKFEYPKKQEKRRGSAKYKSKSQNRKLIKPVEEQRKNPLKKESENRNVINEIKPKSETKEKELEVEEAELLENEIQTPYIPYSIIPRIMYYPDISVIKFGEK